MPEQLPEGLSPLQRAVWDLFVRTCRVRAYGELPSSVPFGREFIAEQLGMGTSEAQWKRAYRARERLDKPHGLLVRVDPNDESNELLKPRGKSAPTHYEPLPAIWP